MYRGPTGSLSPYLYKGTCGVLPTCFFFLSIKSSLSLCYFRPIWRADTLELPLQSSMHQAKLFPPFNQSPCPPTHYSLLLAASSIPPGVYDTRCHHTRQTYLRQGFLVWQAAAHMLVLLAGHVLRYNI